MTVDLANSWNDWRSRPSRPIASSSLLCLKLALESDLQAVLPAAWPYARHGDSVRSIAQCVKPTQRIRISNTARS